MGGFDYASQPEGEGMRAGGPGYAIRVVPAVRAGRGAPA
jgi:hypothetical protein